MIPTTTIHSIIHSIATKLNAMLHNKQLSEQYAWWMLEAICGKNQAALLAQHTINLSHEQQQKLDLWIYNQLEKHEPLQYLIGSVPFNNLILNVKPPVLIPRIETEEWVTGLIEALLPLHTQKLTILDMCTGSGCIALALAKALPNATIYAVDIAPHAIILAQENAQKNNISNITIIQSDLFEQLPRDIKFDCIVSNPPYVTQPEWAELDQSVTAWEDKGALVADNDGLALIERIIDNAPDYLKHNHLLEQHKIPSLLIEIGRDQGNVVAQLMKQANFSNVKIQKDLSGNDRVVYGSAAHVADSPHTQ
jgi:release factor glutamine methyltransferase